MQILTNKIIAYIPVCFAYFVIFGSHIDFCSMLKLNVVAN